MEFLTGLLTGIVFMIFYSQLLAERQRKQARQDADNKLKELRDILQCASTLSLEQQLQRAIEREDYAEAERIRDLMNKR